MIVRVDVPTFHRERLVASHLFFVLAVVLFCAARLPQGQRLPAFGGAEPMRPLGISSSQVRSGLEGQLLLAGNGSGRTGTLEDPVRLGVLQPKGRLNPDGSEVWGYPEGSGLEDLIEVHVKDGRIVREVLRPSSLSSAHAVAGVLSSQDSD